MSCPICKRRQIAILEHIVAIDRIIFNSNKPKDCLSEADYSHYKKIKNAMLVNLYEIYKELDYISENVYKNGIKELNKKSYETGSIVLDETVELFKRKEILKEVNQNISEYIKENKGTTEDEALLKNLFEVALDRLMFENALNGVSSEILEDRKMDLLFKAHKSFRSDLVDIALNSKK